MSTAAESAGIPPVEYRYPDCSLCGKETSSPDGEGLECEHCVVGWPENGDGPGYRLNDDQVRCSAEIAPYAPPYVESPTIAHYRYRCALTEGHGGWCIGTRIDEASKHLLSSSVNTWLRQEVPA